MLLEFDRNIKFRQILNKMQYSFMINNKYLQILISNQEQLSEQEAQQIQNQACYLLIMKIVGEYLRQNLQIKCLQDLENDSHMYLLYLFLFLKVHFFIEDCIQFKSQNFNDEVYLDRERSFNLYEIETILEESDQQIENYIYKEQIVNDIYDYENNQKQNQQKKKILTLNKRYAKLLKPYSSFDEDHLQQLEQIDLYFKNEEKVVKFIIQQCSQLKTKISKIINQPSNTLNQLEQKARITET